MDNKYLIRGKPVIFTENLALILGIVDAIILQRLEYWLQIHEKNNNNYIEGKFWNYNSLDQWQRDIPFFSKSSIKRGFLRLRKKGIVVVGKFNKMKIDRTLWYSIDYDKLKEIINQYSPDDPMVRSSRP